MDNTAQSEKVVLNVAYKDRLKAKNLGATWNNGIKSWQVDADVYNQNKKAFDAIQNTSTSQDKRKPFAEEFAEKICKALEENNAPWQKEWSGHTTIPYNAITNKPYRGSNSLNLYMCDNDDPRWLTYKQAESQGWQVKKGAKGERITFYKSREEKLVLDDEGKPVLDEEGKPKKEEVLLEKGIASVAVVFNAKDIEGIPPLELKNKNMDFTPIELGEQILTNSGANIQHNNINRAFYRPSTDSIHLPPKEHFHSEQGYYSTALHELAHWTGHEDRLNRNFGETRSSNNYAREELRAEISSWLISIETGLPNNPENHASYIKSWIKDIKEDPNELIRACRDAEKIKDFVLDLHIQKEILAEEEQVKTSEVEPTRVYLSVPFEQKDEAYKLGAKFDGDNKAWYCMSNDDTSLFNKWLPDEQIRSNVTPPNNASAEVEFAEKLREFGLDLPELPIIDGSIHRVPVAGKNAYNKDGAYCCFSDGVPAGWAKNFVTGETINFVYSGHTMTKEELAQQQAERVKKIQEREENRSLLQNETSERAKEEFKNSSPVRAHQYIENKGISAILNSNVIKVNENNQLLIPVYNTKGDMRGLQYINEDGSKYFMKDMEKKGNFCMLRGNSAEFLICEGFATGATLHEATGKCVIVAFDASNLDAVTSKVRALHPNAPICLCADDDHKNKVNVGIDKAQEVANKYNCNMEVPKLTADEKAQGLTDFNDLHKSRGIDAVRNQFAEMDRQRLVSVQQTVQTQQAKRVDCDMEM